MIVRRRMTVFGLALCVAAAAAAPATAAGGTVYVTNYISDNLSQYSIGAGGLLSPLTPPTVSTGNGGYEVAISPDGRSVYATNYDAPFGVTQWDVTATGALAPKAPPSIATATASPYGIAVSPDGRSLYITHDGGGTLTQFDIGAGGQLTAKTPPTVATGNSPYAVGVSPDGRSVYVANFGGATISQYSADAAGKLTPKTPATVPSAPGSFSITTTPDGRSLYVANLSSGSVSQYDVAADGRLTPKTPATVTGLSNPAQVLVTPDGRHAYVTNNGNATVAQFDIGAGGRLMAKTPATVPAGGGPGKAALTPDGRNLYVGNFGANSVSQYSIGATGLLTALTPPTLAAGSNPRGVAITPNQGPRAVFAAAAAPSGPVASFDGSGSTDPDGTVARYDWDFGDGTTAANGGANPSHTYPAGGTYTVKLTVTDNGGCSAALIFTGQTTLCNGSSAARATRTVTVAPPAFGAGTLVSLELAVKKIRAKGRVSMQISNGNTFAVTGRLGGKTARKVTVAAKRRIALKSKSFTVAAHGRTTVRLRLPRSLRALLTSRRKLSLVMTAKVKDPAGNERTVRKRVAPKLRR